MSHATFWIAAIGLPFVGALHRFVISYCCRGVTRTEAWREAWQVAVLLSIISGLFIVAHLLERQP